MPVRITDEETSGTTNFLSKPVADAHYVNQSGDSLGGDLDMNNNKINNAVITNAVIMNAELDNCTVTVTPSSDTHLVNKSYLDTRLQGLDEIYVNEGTDTMRGELRMSRNRITGLPAPVMEADAVNKKYVDKHNNWFNYSVGKLEIQKPVDMNSNKITELADPTDDNDAVNKKYCDKLLLVPIIIPIHIEEANVGTRKARIQLIGVNLNTILSDARQVLLVFNYHPYVKQIEKQVNNNKLNIIFKLEHTEIIHSFSISGLVVIHEDSAINAGGELRVNLIVS